MMDKTTLVDGVATFDYTNLDQVETADCVIVKQKFEQDIPDQLHSVSSVLSQSLMDQANSCVIHEGFEDCGFNKCDAKRELAIYDQAVIDQSLKRRRNEDGHNFEDQLQVNSILPQDGQKLFTCQFSGCYKTFAFEHQLTYHIRVHTSKKPYKCSWNGCHKSAFPSATYFVTHTLNEHIFKKTYKCSWLGCTKEFAQSRFLAGHLRVHNEQSRNIAYDCQECNASFVCKSSLTRHLRIHQR